MSAYKQLNRQDVYISDYQAQKNWRANGSGLTTYGIETLRGFSGSTPGYPYPNDYRNNRYEKLVFDSIHHLYYSLTSGSIPNGGGEMYYTGSYDVSFQTSLMLSQSRKESTEVAVISVPKEVYGTKIVPGTFVADLLFNDDDKYLIDGYARDKETGVNQYTENINHWYNSSPIDIEEYLVSESSYIDESSVEYLITSSGFQRPEIIDDGKGRLIISGAEAYYTDTERYVGDIIYDQGNAIITDPTVARYYSTYGRLNVAWKSNLPIYTYNVHCTIKESELNHTFNPSAITGSSNTVRNNITGSDFRPYVTSIGLYNEANELIAVAKTNRPVPRAKNVDTTFVVKFDI